ncbi:MAG: sugar phosphate isomerase/epimerase [Bacteroidales bacterium]|jgi:hexulose-6-phosphate isomerase|nr:sugar phosphate isomerase/epimerase [Bacteroidales bacterium]
MMQRRNFIKNTILATGAFSLAGNCAFAGGVSKTQPANAGFKKSIMWGTVGIEGSVLDKCKAVKEAGFQGIEPNSHMDRKEVIDAAKATGLAITDVCCSTHWGKPLSHPDATVRQEGIDGAIVALEDAKAYGTDAILLVPGTVNDTVAYDECWNRSTEGIKKLLPVAEKMKVKICIENVWNNFLLSPMEACRFVDQFNSQYVKFYFDCGNILVYGWPEQWVSILGDRIGRIHIKEFSKQIADRQGRGAGFGAPLTEGDVNWAKVMEALRKSYKNVWLATEQGGNKTLEELKDLSKRFDKILSM